MTPIATFFSKPVVPTSHVDSQKLIQLVIDYQTRIRAQKDIADFTRQVAIAQVLEKLMLLLEALNHHPEGQKLLITYYNHALNNQTITTGADLVEKLPDFIYAERDYILALGAKERDVYLKPGILGTLFLMVASGLSGALAAHVTTALIVSFALVSACALACFVLAALRGFPNTNLYHHFNEFMHQIGYHLQLNGQYKLQKAATVDLPRMDTYICNPDGQGVNELKNGLTGEARYFSTFKARSAQIEETYSMG